MGCPIFIMGVLWSDSAPLFINSRGPLAPEPGLSIAGGGGNIMHGSTNNHLIAYYRTEPRDHQRPDQSPREKFDHIFRRSPTIYKGTGSLAGGCKEKTRNKRSISVSFLFGLTMLSVHHPRPDIEPGPDRTRTFSYSSQSSRGASPISL